MNANELKSCLGIDLPVKAHSTEICQNGHGFIVKWKCDVDGVTACCSVCRKKYTYDQPPPGWDIVEIVCKMCLDKQSSEHANLEASISSMHMKLKILMEEFSLAEKSQKTGILKLVDQIAEHETKLKNLVKELQELDEKSLQKNREYDYVATNLTSIAHDVSVANLNLLTTKNKIIEMLGRIKLLPNSDGYPDDLKTALADLKALSVDEHNI